MRYEHSVCISMTGRWSATTYLTISMHIPTAITSILTELSAQGKKLHAWASSCVMTQNVNHHLRYHTNTLSWTPWTLAPPRVVAVEGLCGDEMYLLIRGLSVLSFFYFFFPLKLKLSQNSSTHNTICAGSLPSTTAINPPSEHAMRNNHLQKIQKQIWDISKNKNNNIHIFQPPDSIQSQGLERKGVYWKYPRDEAGMEFSSELSTNAL